MTLNSPESAQLQATTEPPAPANLSRPNEWNAEWAEYRLNRRNPAFEVLEALPFTHDVTLTVREGVCSALALAELLPEGTGTPDPNVALDSADLYTCDRGGVRSHAGHAMFGFSAYDRPIDEELAHTCARLNLKPGDALYLVFMRGTNHGNHFQASRVRLIAAT